MTAHQTIAHRWAQDTGASLKGYAMHCASGVIYSWGNHFPIARFMNTPARRGKPSQRVILWNADSYSTSTSKHQTYTRRALRPGIPVIVVPGLCEHTDYSAAHNGKHVLEYHESKASEAFAKAARARVNGPWLLGQAERHLSDAEAFAGAFGHKWKRPDQAGLVAKAEAKAKAQAKAAKEQAKRRAEAEAYQRERDSEAFAMWQAGDSAYCPTSYRRAPDGSAYVTRYKGAAIDELRTSQGAAVPWDHAVKAFRFIALCVARGEGWQRNGRTVRVGHYSLDSIDKGGDMVAGCHRFVWDQMRALAEREGVLDLAPSDEAVTVTH